MPERLTRVGLVSSFGPYDRPGATDGMDRMNKVSLFMAHRMPWAVIRWMTGKMEKAFAKDPEGTARRRFSSLPPPDQAALSDEHATDMLLASMTESFRPGAAGSAWEGRLLTRPWGFELEDVTVPVLMWQGDADVNCPLSTATHLSSAIPNASLTVLPDKGHFFILEQWGAIIRELVD